MARHINGGISYHWAISDVRRDKSTQPAAYEVRGIPAEWIVPPHSARDRNKVCSMVAFEQMGGPLPPLLLLQQSEQSYQALGGSHRYVAFQELGYDLIPSYIITEEMHEYAEHLFKYQTGYWATCEELGHHEQNGTTMPEHQPAFWAMATEQLMSTDGRTWYEDRWQMWDAENEIEPPVGVEEFVKHVTDNELLD